MDLLIRKESDGLRIAGIYNRLASIPDSSATELKRLKLNYSVQERFFTPFTFMVY